MQQVTVELAFAHFAGVQVAPLAHAARSALDPPPGMDNVCSNVVARAIPRGLVRAVEFAIVLVAVRPCEFAGDAAAAGEAADEDVSIRVLKPTLTVNEPGSPLASVA